MDNTSPDLIHEDTLWSTKHIKKARHHFSRLGLIYFLSSLLSAAGQNAAVFFILTFFPALSEHYGIYYGIILLFTYALTIAFTCLAAQTLPSGTIRQRRMSARQWFLALLVAYTIMYLSNLLGQFITYLIGVIKGTAVNTPNVYNTITELPFWAVILFVVVIGPFVEELLYRKILIDRIVLYGELPAVLLSALIFGLRHGNLNQFAYAFTVGMLFAFIYLKTGRIRYSFFLHMTLNFLGSVPGLLLLEYINYAELSLLLEDPYQNIEALIGYLPQLAVLMLYSLLLLIVVLAGIIVFIFHIKKIRLTPQTNELPKNKYISVMLRNAGMILFSAYWLIRIILQL